MDYNRRPLGKTLKLTLEHAPFTVMLELRKNTEYKPLVKPDGKIDEWILTRLFPRKEGRHLSSLAKYDLENPRHYKYVQFFNCGGLWTKGPWFIRPYQGLKIVYNVNRMYGNGLEVHHSNIPVASISLGRKIVCAKLA